MITMDNSTTKEQLTTLALIGLVILGLFAAGFVWLYYYVGVLGNGGGEVVLALSPYWVFPYLVVSSVYVGFFAARFATGRGKHAWLWGIAGFALNSCIHPWFSRLVIPCISVSKPYNIRRPGNSRISSTGTLGTVNRAVNIHPQKGNCVDGRTSHWV